MVSSRRQISRDEDRYGGFAEIAASDVGEREISDDILNMRSYVTPSVQEAPPSDTASAAEAPAPRERREAVAPASTAASVRTAPVRTAPAASETATPAKPRRISDVMPEIVRPVRKEKTAAAQPAPVIRERKLTASAKRALIIYMSVVLAIVAGIIATGVAVSSVSAQVTNYESSIAAMEETVAQQREILAQLDNEAVIADEAGKLGMVPVDETTGYDRMEIGETEEEAGGIFDAIRDWFNAIFGG